MARIIEGVSLVAGAVVLGVFSAGIGAAVFGSLLSATVEASTIVAIASSVGSLGVSLLASGIAQALGFGPSLGYSVRSPAASRQGVWGETRISGTIIYCSTSSGGNHLNQIVVWAGARIVINSAIYMDARSVLPMQAPQVFAQCDSNAHTDDAGNSYNLAGTVYSEHFLGSTAGYWFESLYSNDPSWDSSCTLNGCAASYFRLTYSASVFPSEPGIRATVTGRPLYDPRLGAYGAAGTVVYSATSSLCILDCLLDKDFGLGCDISEINIDNFIQASNICEELVPLAAGGTEQRYRSNGSFSYDSPAGEILSALLLSCAGKIIYVQGQYSIFPGAFYSSGAIYDQTSILAPIKWIAQPKVRDKFNAVRAKWISPKFPYNSVGFSADHRDPSIFGGEFQAADIPEMFLGPSRGYPFDEYLAQDGGVRLYLDATFRFISSVGQAQRVAKIALVRSRQLGAGTWQMNLSAMLSQPQDVIQIDWPQLGLLSQYHEISSMRFDVTDSDDESESAVKAKRIVVTVETQATDPSVYLWSTAEELTFEDAQSPTIGQAWSVAPVTDMVCESGSDSAVIGYDGVTIPRINVTFLPSEDPFTISGGHYELQIQKASAPATWTPVGTYDTSISQIFVSNVICNVGYNLQLRAVRSNGMASAWAQVLSHVVSITLSTITAETISGLGPLATLPYIDFASGTEIINKTASNMLYSTGYTVESLRPYESLADKTSNQTLDVLQEGVIFNRVLAGQVLQGYLGGQSNGANLLQNGGWEFNLTNVPAATYIGIGGALCDNWSVGQIGVGISAFHDVSSSARSGGSCCCITTVPGAYVTGSNNGVRVFSTKTACLGGAFLNYGGYVNCQANTPVPTGAAIVVRVGLYFFASNGTFLSETYDQMTYTAGTSANYGGYNLYQGTCVVPMGAAQMCFNACLFSSIGAFTPPAGTTVCAARFDDCFINQQYPTSTLLAPQGSVQGNEVPNITFTMTSSSISLSWASTVMLRADGNSTTFAAGSQTISGLSASTCSATIRTPA